MLFFPPISNFPILSMENIPIRALLREIRRPVAFKSPNPLSDITLPQSRMGVYARRAHFRDTYSRSSILALTCQTKDCCQSLISEIAGPAQMRRHSGHPL